MKLKEIVFMDDVVWQPGEDESYTLIPPLIHIHYKNELVEIVPLNNIRSLTPITVSNQRCKWCGKTTKTCPKCKT